MKPIVYIETTIPSYYWDERPSLTFEILRTREWWDQERDDYRLISSQPVLTELGHPLNPNREKCLNLMQGIPLVALNSEVKNIAIIYVSRKIMPSSMIADALHLALAGFYKADFLLTWNCRHLANANKFRMIHQINSELGIYTPVLTTPYELRRIPQEDSSHERE